MSHHLEMAILTSLAAEAFLSSNSYDSVHQYQGWPKMKEAEEEIKAV